MCTYSPSYHFVPVDIVVEVFHHHHCFLSLLGFSPISYNPFSTSSFDESSLKELHGLTLSEQCDTPINAFSFPSGSRTACFLWICHSRYPPFVLLVILFLTYSIKRPWHRAFLFSLSFLNIPSKTNSLSAISSFAQVSMQPIMSGSSLYAYNSYFHHLIIIDYRLLLTLAKKHFNTTFLAWSTFPVWGLFTAFPSLQFSLVPGQFDMKK